MDSSRLGRVELGPVNTYGSYFVSPAYRTFGPVWYKNPLGDPNGIDVRDDMSTRCHVETSIPVDGGDSGSALFKNRGYGIGGSLVVGDFMGIQSYRFGSLSGFASWNNIVAALGSDVRTRLE